MCVSCEKLSRPAGAGASDLLVSFPCTDMHWRYYGFRSRPLQKSKCQSKSRRFVWFASAYVSYIYKCTIALCLKSSIISKKKKNHVLVSLQCFKYFIAKKCKLSSDNAGLPPTFNLKKKNPAISAKHSKVRHSTARYACVQVFSSKGKVKLEALGVNPYFVFRL